MGFNQIQPKCDDLLEEIRDNIWKNQNAKIDFRRDQSLKHAYKIDVKSVDKLIEIIKVSLSFCLNYLFQLLDLFRAAQKKMLKNVGTWIKSKKL